MNKLSVKLWISMMLLVLLTVVFLWVTQIWLFEGNYLKMEIGRSTNQLLSIINKSEDLTHPDFRRGLAQLDSEILILDAAGSTDLLQNNGANNNINLPPTSFTVDAIGMPVPNMRQRRSNISSCIELAPQVVNGEYKVKVIKNGDIDQHTLIVGAPIIVNEKIFAIFMIKSLSSTSTLQMLLRHQVMILCIILTIVASAIAWVLTRNFTKPILSIEKSVERLKDGDLNATPDVKRKDELGKLSRSVDALSAALRKTDVLRRELIANVSHELRTPLSLIRGYAELVRDMSWKNDTQREDNLNLIIEESDHMSSMVTDILDYSQFESGCMKLNQTEAVLVEILESAVSAAKKQAEPFDVDVVLINNAGNAVVYADVMKMGQVLRNLLNNAINHTENGRQITVTANIKFDEILVEVINPGTPISKEDQGQIWERYYRVQRQGGRRHGTGLGLSIVRTILESHGIKYGVTCNESVTCSDGVTCNEGVTCNDGLISFWFLIQGSVTK